MTGFITSAKDEIKLSVLNERMKLLPCVLCRLPIATELQPIFNL